MGVYLLIAMSIVFIVCIRGYYADVKHIAPKQIDVFDEWLIQSRSRKYIRILTGALAAIALFIIIDANRKNSVSTDANAVADEVALAEQAEATTSEASSEQPSESETLAAVTPSETSNDENTASATETPIEPQKVVGQSEETAPESTTTSTEATTNSADNTPTTYNTQVGEKGVTLSGGQKQRIAIARMLVLNKPIIIFDDSLSALDTKTDLQIRNALKTRNEQMTSIIITHRITTAKEADKIIVLENGKVSAMGTHEELAKQPGLYKSLWDIQGALESEFLEMVNKEVSD